MGIYKGKIKGIIGTCQSAEGTLSEGPIYFLKPTDHFKKWNEISIRTRVMRWMQDPLLDKFIKKEVILEGEIIETKDTISIDYTGVNYQDQYFPVHTENFKQTLDCKNLEDPIVKFLKKDKK